MYICSQVCKDDGLLLSFGGVLYRYLGENLCSCFPAILVRGALIRFPFFPYELITSALPELQIMREFGWTL